MPITAEELAKRYAMDPHVENGAYIEQHYEYKGDGRADSGMIYYYVAPMERTEFHVIDCDEYWCYVEGSPLELWMVDPASGNVNTVKFGVEEGCEPVVYFPKGRIFASKNHNQEEGTFLSCITVPRFDPNGFRLCSLEEMVKDYPDTKEFYQ